MTPYKLKLWTTGEHDLNFELTDIYVNMDKVIGFLITERTEEEEELGDAVNLFFEHGTKTVSLEPHVEKYLRENFTDNAIEG